MYAINNDGFKTVSFSTGIISMQKPISGAKSSGHSSQVLSPVASIVLSVFSDLPLVSEGRGDDNNPYQGIQSPLLRDISCITLFRSSIAEKLSIICGSHMWVAELLQQAPAVYRRSPYGFSLHLHNAIHISGDAYSTMLSPLPLTLLFGATKLYSPEAGACAMHVQI